MTKSQKPASTKNDGRQAATPPSVRNPHWYKDAIVYQLHIKAFQDSNADGIGDFPGLISRLDYVQQLGVTAIWLLPFYPSPLRDDGYDIADYFSVNPSYGTIRDFRRFVQEAHRRDIAVITELVVNHTSDQHEWFQKARHAKKGSPARDFYVWSDTDTAYSGTRIIFTDTEKSNWTWDPVAGQYFWHRFFSHQPDLNFDNPKVIEAVLKAMRFWLDMGVDGLRLDAVPYLVEREGTNNENLPETHAVLKRIRAEIDRDYPGRMLLAEANQWPEDTLPYFGDGDECHMAFNFPLMPRMYMAVAQEDRHPITDIMRQTPEPPEPCQWAVFLRNHDELTLEMVTANERDYLWATYAADKRARINLGIRRRLAPLMQNDRRKIELLNAMLLSQRGTPVLYYGDELGMGDNIYLGDRDGVRTPMQWSFDRNAGFSRATPQQLYLPPIMDPVYGFQAINVETQQSEPNSQLNWTRRMVAIRGRHPAFGRGRTRLVYPRNRHILAYVREDGDTRILCVFNLASTAQAVELELPEDRGRVPIEMLGSSPMPPIGELPYMLTLPAYGFFWFLLATEADAPHWHIPHEEPMPEMLTLTLPGASVASLFTGERRAMLEREVLPQMLMKQRWFAGKDAGIGFLAMEPIAALDQPPTALTIVRAGEDEAHATPYFVPLAVLWGEEHVQRNAPRGGQLIARVRSGPRMGALVDAALDPHYAAGVYRRLRENHSVQTSSGTLNFRSTRELPDLSGADVRRLTTNQSNVSMALGGQVVMKLYRRFAYGVQPESEVSRFLTVDAGFESSPAYLGDLGWTDAEGREAIIASAFAYVANQGDAWTAIVNALSRELHEIAVGGGPAGDGADVAEQVGHWTAPLTLAALLGQRTGQMHAALAIETANPDFGCVAATPADLARWRVQAVAQIDAAVAALKALPRDVRERVAVTHDGAAAAAAEPAAPSVAALIRQATAWKALARKAGTAAGGLTRTHGDYHLGQVLLTQTDVCIVDFEGEPGKPIDERRARTSPLRDVAGMLRSFDYAAHGAAADVAKQHPSAQARIREAITLWLAQSRTAFLAGYRSATAGIRSVPADNDALSGLIALFELEKSAYEICYEAGNRPDWIDIPVLGVHALLERGAGTPATPPAPRAADAAAGPPPRKDGAAAPPQRKTTDE